MPDQPTPRPLRQRFADALRVLLADRVVILSFNDGPGEGEGAVHIRTYATDAEVRFAGRLLLAPKGTIAELATVHSGGESALQQARDILSPS